MPRRDVIVVGASAGGVEALTTLVRGLPSSLPAALFIVLHLPATAHSVLPEILSRAGPLAATHTGDGEKIRPGRIYVAPPNRHLLLERGRVRLGDGPRENRVRPSADVLFRSAARAYGRRVIGVILSGTDGDGTLGLHAIRLRGGLTVVQDPTDAPFPSMPANAIERVGVDYVADVAQIPPLLTKLVEEGPENGGGPTMASDLPLEQEQAGDEDVPLAYQKRDGAASGLTCPDCFGSIWELTDGDLVRLECRVGHRYNPEAFLGAQSERVEAALWTAMNVLQERAAALRQFAARFARGGRLASEYEARARDTDQQAAAIRAVLEEMVRTDVAEGDETA